MSKRVHTTVTGQRIEFEPPPKVAAFLARLEDAIHDSAISERELTGLAFSSENPFLDHSFLPGRASVTKDVLADPAYHVMADLLFRKQLAEDKTDVAKLAARYSMTVAEAAAELGVHESAIRQAIAARRLASWIKDGRHYLDPKALRSFELGARAGRGAATKAVPPEPAGGPLDIIMGHGSGGGLKVKSALPLADVERLEGNRLHAQLPSWRRVVVLTTGIGGSQRAWVLEPGPDENAIEHEPFYVRGRFRVVEQAGAGRRAREMWSATEVE